MPTDHYGNSICIGDTIRYVVGLPGREVRATVYEKNDYHGWRLYVRDGTNEIAVGFILDLFDCRVVNRASEAAQK